MPCTSYLGLLAGNNAINLATRADKTNQYRHHPPLHPAPGWISREPLPLLSTRLVWSLLIYSREGKKKKKKHEWYASKFQERGGRGRGVGTGDLGRLQPGYTFCNLETFLTPCSGAQWNINSIFKHPKTTKIILCPPPPQKKKKNIAPSPERSDLNK